MNKKIFSLPSLLVVFVLTLMCAPFAFASTSPVRSESFAASVTFIRTSTNPITIRHDQTIFVLQHSSFSISGSVSPDLNVTVDAVKLEYYYETTYGSSTIISTSSYNDVTGAFSFFVDNVNMEPDYIFYRIIVDYTQNLTPSLIPVYSGWYTIKNPTIDHDDIIRISPFQRRMVAIGNVSNIGATDLKVEYFVNGDSNTLCSINTDNPVTFTCDEINIADHETLVHYRLVAAFDGDDTKIKYYPSVGWLAVPVTSSSTASIGPAGGVLLLDNEDQRYGKSSIRVYENALPGNTDIIFEECDTAASYVWSASNNIVKIYKLEPEAVAFGAGVQPADLTLYYGNENEGKYEIKYWNGTSWVSLTTSQDITKKTVSAKIDTLGYFAVFNRGAGSDNDYRPLDRAFMPGETIQFRNLQPGDSVTIYNTKGKQIKKISNGDNDWKWDGRTSGGGYAESGSYIYQIKVEGKVISGSLAFVR